MPACLSQSVLSYLSKLQKPGRGARGWSEGIEVSVPGEWAASQLICTFDSWLCCQGSCRRHLHSDIQILVLDSQQNGAERFKSLPFDLSYCQRLIPQHIICYKWSLVFPFPTVSLNSQAGPNSWSSCLNLSSLLISSLHRHTKSGLLFLRNEKAKRLAPRTAGRMLTAQWLWVYLKVLPRHLASCFPGPLLGEKSWLRDRVKR